MASVVTHYLLRRVYLTVIILLLSGYAVFGQISPWIPASWPEELEFAVKGTGRTTGHIADITVRNPTKKDVILDFPALYLPATIQYQPYIIPFSKQISVSAGSSITFQGEGYCVDIHRAPVPFGEAMSPVSTWIAKDPDLFNSTGIDAIKLMDYWELVKPDVPGNLPGHSVIEFFALDYTKVNPLISNHVPTEMIESKGSPSGGYSIYIPGDNAMLAVPLYFDAIDKIIYATDSLSSNGEILTPYSGIPDKERESVIQHTFWMYTSALHNEPYTKNDFAEKLVEQFEEASGHSVSIAPTQVQEQLIKGVDDFWKTFQLVGVEAKVFYDETRSNNRIK